MKGPKCSNNRNETITAYNNIWWRPRMAFAKVAFNMPIIICRNIFGEFSLHFLPSLIISLVHSPVPEHYTINHFDIILWWDVFRCLFSFFSALLFFQFSGIHELWVYSTRTKNTKHLLLSHFIPHHRHSRGEENFQWWLYPKYPSHIVRNFAIQFFVELLALTKSFLLAKLALKRGCWWRILILKVES